MKRTLLSPALGLALLAFTATPATGQDYVFNHVTQDNQWSWIANTSLGGLTGVPDNNFEVQGTSNVTLSGSPFTNGVITGASQTVTQDLNGYIPGPFGIHLADIIVTNLVFSVTTDSFTIDAAGNFNTNWTVMFESGSLSVTPFGGSASVTDLAGTFGPPTANGGSVTIDASGDVVIHSDQSAVFSFVDAGTGISADFTITGTFHGTADLISAGPGSSFCSGDGSGTACPCGNTGGAGEGCANDTGSGSVLSGSGSASVLSDNLVLSANNLTPGPGLFFQGNNAINSGNGNAFGDGLRCAGGGVRRLEVTFANAGNSFTTSTSVSIVNDGNVSVGDTRRYQYWYRDSGTSPCGTLFNLSNGYEVTWGN
jgi:hypothetical protein